MHYTCCCCIKEVVVVNAAVANIGFVVIFATVVIVVVVVVDIGTVTILIVTKHSHNEGCRDVNGVCVCMGMYGVRENDRESERVSRGI